MTRKYELVILGGSAGSLEVIMQNIASINKNINAAILIVLHRKTSNDNILVGLLSSKTTLKVKEAEEKESIVPGIIYIAPADYHLLIEKDRSFSLDFSEKINFSRPSIDVTFESAADVYLEAVACILLSGANSDGVEGLKAIKQNGGLAAVQNPLTAEVSYMPQHALNAGVVDLVLQKEEIAAFINRLNTP